MISFTVHAAMHENERVRWRTWIELPDPLRLWVASTAFVVIGALLLAAAPSLIDPPDPDTEAVGLAMRLLGGTFLALGLAVLLPMFYSLRLSERERKVRFYWWMHFIGGLLGTLTFAVPATGAFPAFLVAYLMRPNALAPDDDSAINNLGVAAILSLTGVVVLVALFFLAHHSYRTRDAQVEARLV